MSLSALSSSSTALQIEFAAILNASSDSDNSTAIVLEAIRYSISQSQVTVAPHTIALNELEVEPEPPFALQPFSQLYQFTSNPNRRLQAGIDGTVDGLAKYFLSNASVPFVSLFPELENPKFRYEIRTEFSAEVWAEATTDLLDRFGWRDICVAFAYSEEHKEIVSVKNAFLELWISKGNRSVDVVSSFDSESSSLAAADACSQKGRRAMIVFADGEAAHMFISELWGKRLYAMETIWVSPFESSELRSFESQTPSLSSFFKSGRCSGFFTLQVSAGSESFKQGLMNHLAQFFNDDELKIQERNVIIAHDTIRMVSATIKAMMDAGDDLSDADAFMNRFKTNHLGFLGASGSFSFDSNGDRDGFIQVYNWKGNSSSAIFSHLWSWSTGLGLHNTVDNVPSPLPATTLRFFSGSSDIPPNDTPPVLNIAIAYAKSIGILNQWEYSAQIAINHAIQDNVLPGYSINLIVVNTQAQESVAVRGALDALSTVRPHAFIGGTLNAETIALQYVLKGAQVPQIGPTASSEQLARRDSNPYFMRPVASEYDEAKSILSLMQKYDWSNVAIIVSDDDVGSGGSDALDRAFLAGTNVTIMSRQIIALPTNDDTVRQQLSVVKRSNARIVICIMGLSGFPSILRVGTELGMFTSDYAWIMGGQARLIDTFSDTVSSLLVPGVLLIGRYEGEGQIFDRLKSDMMALPRTSYPYSGSVVGITTGVGYVYDACMTVIKAAAIQRGLGISVSNGTRMYKSMNSVSFNGATGKVEYDNGERVYSAVLVMYRGQNKTWTEFARVQRANKTLNSYEFSLTSSPLFIGGKATPPVDVYLTFVSYTSAEGLVMCIAAALLMLCALGSILIVIRFHENILLRASSPVFLIMILIGIIISLAGPFLYAGAPDNIKCHLQMWFFIMGFVIAYGSIVVKNFRLWRLWDMSTMKIVRITNWHLIAYSQVFVVPFLLFLILYSAADPPRARLSGNGLTCQTSSVTWYIVILGCVAIMLLFGAFVSFKIRSLPQLFNECKYISVSTYNLTICLALGVSLFSILGNISATAAYTAYSFAIIFGYGGMWAIIFIPKFWIIFVTPERLKELESGTSGVTRGTGSNSGPRTTVTLSDQSMTHRSKSRSSRSSGKDSATSPRSMDSATSPRSMD